MWPLVDLLPVHGDIGKMAEEVVTVKGDWFLIVLGSDIFIVVYYKADHMR